MWKTLFIIWICLCTVLAAQYKRPGSSAAQFLKIGVSPRGTAMGDAYIAAANGAEATFYNPAALAMSPDLNVVFYHTEWFAGINHEFAAAAKTLGPWGTFGLSVTALYTDEMAVRTPLQPDGTGETFFAGNYRFGLSYARRLTSHVSFGGTISYINIDLYSDFTADAISGDIAVLYNSGFRGFRFGMKFSNFGSEIKFVNESYPLPTNFTFGLGMNAVEAGQQTVLVTVNATKPNDEEPLGQVGLEYNWNDMFFLRGGYQINHEVASYSVGGGVATRLSSLGFNLDYSMSEYDLLGFTHRFGIRINLSGE